MPNHAPQPTACPGCSCELKPGTEAAHAIDGSCPHTKAPTARELDTRISKVLRAANDGIVAIRHDFEARCKGIEAKMDNLFGCGIDMASRLEALERAHTNGVGGAVLRKHPVAVGDAVSETDPPADSALPERPSSLDNPWHVSMFSGTAARARCEAANDERKYALSLESRLAEYEKGAHENNERWRQGVLEVWDVIGHDGQQPPDLASRVKRLLADRDALKAKLAEAEKQRDEYAGSNLRTALKLADLSEALARERTDRDALRAKLDGVREAAEKWEMSPEAFEMYNEGRSVKASLDRVGRFAIKSALAAAENTNTGAARLSRESQGVEPGIGRVPSGEAPSLERPVSSPASTHPSPAPAFELSKEDSDDLLSRACVWEVQSSASMRRDTWAVVIGAVERIVRTALRDSREGWVTKTDALIAIKMALDGIAYPDQAWTLEYPEQCLAASIRAEG